MSQMFQYEVWSPSAPDKLFTVDNVCVYSNSRNDIPRVAQRYGTVDNFINGDFYTEKR